MIFAGPGSDLLEGSGRFWKVGRRRRPDEKKRGIPQIKG